eukprot:scaffold485_cov414-Prasinococcus_capsulatus_cf.AAC.1
MLLPKTFVKPDMSSTLGRASSLRAYSCTFCADWKCAGIVPTSGNLYGGEKYWYMMGAYSVWAASAVRPTQNSELGEDKPTYPLLSRQPSLHDPRPPVQCMLSCGNSSEPATMRTMSRVKPG